MSPPKQRLKVLHLITLSVVGGSQDNTFCTAELHDRRDYDVHLACNPSGQWIDRGRAVADVFHPIPSLVTELSPLKDLQSFFTIFALLRREQYDIVHTHTAKAGFIGRLCAWLCRVPVVIHTYHAFPFHRFMPAWKRTFYRSLERLVRPMTDFFITVSQNERDEGALCRVLRKRASQTVYSGIDLDRLDAPVDTTQLRRELGLDPDTPVVLMAGRLDQQKSPHLIIEAFARVLKRHPRAVLLLAGDGELRPLCEATIARLNLSSAVRLLGFRSDIPSLLKAADVFALSSLWEGLGRAMTEAMLLGKAVVVPRINGIPEVVRHNQTGLLYEAGRVSELAESLSAILGNPEERERLGNNARELTRQLFDVREMVVDIESIYRWVIQSKEKEARGIHFGLASLLHARPVQQTAPFQTNSRRSPSTGKR